MESAGICYMPLTLCFDSGSGHNVSSDKYQICESKVFDRQIYTVSIKLGIFNQDLTKRVLKELLIVRSNINHNGENLEKNNKAINDTEENYLLST